MTIDSSLQPTEYTLQTAFQYAIEHKLSAVVVASTSGKTGLLAAQMRPKAIPHLTIVSHNTGFGQAGIQQMPQTTITQIETKGATVYTGTLVLRGLGSAIRKKMKYSEEEIVADTLRMFGQGMKVCCEMAAMVCDGGCFPHGDAVFVGGTANGADTAVHIHPAPSNDFFAMKVKHVIVKPDSF